MASPEDWQVASTSQASSGRKRSAFDLLSGRPPKCPQPTRCGPGSRGKSADKAARLYSWYYQHFEPLAGQGRQDDDMGSDVVSDACAEELEEVDDPQAVDWDD
jgi:hypothetical protein